jgi:hypothetical protein
VIAILGNHYVLFIAFLAYSSESFFNSLFLEPPKTRIEIEIRQKAA